MTKTTNLRTLMTLMTVIVTIASCASSKRRCADNYTDMSPEPDTGEASDTGPRFTLKTNTSPDICCPYRCSAASVSIQPPAGQYA